LVGKLTSKTSSSLSAIQISLKQKIDCIFYNVFRI
jgi:hypothetical protein